MAIRLRITLTGIGAVEIEGDNNQEIIAEAALWSDLPKCCPTCGAPIRLSYRTPGEYTYYGLTCLGDVPHESTFGQRKKGGTLYYKRRVPWAVAPNGYEE